MKIIAIDAGNTHVRYAVVDTEQKQCGEIHRVNRSEMAEAFCVLHGEYGSSLACAVATVVESVREWLPAAFKDAGFSRDIIWCDLKDSHLITTEYEKSLGIDRFVDAVAAAALFPGEDLIVIDSGTATTVDFVARNNHFLGGYIIPGIGLKARVITEGTDKLPAIDPYKLELQESPVDTFNAIAGGLLLDCAGGIEKAVHQGNKVLSSPRVVACGGGWEIIGPYVNLEITEVPHLTLLGTALRGAEIITERV